MCAWWLSWRFGSFPFHNKFFLPFAILRFIRRIVTGRGGASWEPSISYLARVACPADCRSRARNVQRRLKPGLIKSGLADHASCPCFSSRTTKGVPVTSPRRRSFSCGMHVRRRDFGKRPFCPHDRPDAMAAATPKRCDFVTGVYVHESRPYVFSTRAWKVYTCAERIFRPSGAQVFFAQKAAGAAGNATVRPEVYPGRLPTTINRRHVVTFSRAYHVHTCRLPRCNRKRPGPRGPHTAVGGEGF